MNDKGFFYADYSVGKVTVASKTVDAGQYTVELLNQYYKDDTAARISDPSPNHPLTDYLCSFVLPFHSSLLYLHNNLYTKSFCFHICISSLHACRISSMHFYS